MSQHDEPHRAERRRPYRTIAVVLVVAGLLVVPVLALLGHNRLAVLWMAAPNFPRMSSMVCSSISSRVCGIFFFAKAIHIPSPVRTVG